MPSLSIQVDPSLPGHVALAINEPTGQTYVGFGPQHHGWPYDRAKFDVQPVRWGETPPPDYSNVLGTDRHATFTIPISEEQAKAAHEEIERIKADEPLYNGLSVSDPRICTTIANRILRAVGLGDSFYTLPRWDFGYLSDITDTLANDPKARVARESGLPIPNELRGIQRDYAYVGAGYDTPSERIRRVASGEQNADMSSSGRPGAVGWLTSQSGADGFRISRCLRHRRIVHSGFGVVIAATL